MDTLSPDATLLLCECALVSRHLNCDSLSREELTTMLELQSAGLVWKVAGDWRLTNRGNLLAKDIRIEASKMQVRDPFKYYETQAKKMENPDEKL